MENIEKIAWTILELVRACHFGTQFSIISVPGLIKISASPTSQRTFSWARSSITIRYPDLWENITHKNKETTLHINTNVPLGEFIRLCIAYYTSKIVVCPDYKEIFGDAINILKRSVPQSLFEE